MALLVRSATLDDLPFLIEYNQRLAQETEGHILDRTTLESGIRALLLDAHKGFYLVAEDTTTAEVVGQLQITTEWSDWRNGWFWWLQSVYVAAHAREHGVFRMLFEAIEAQALTAGNVIGLRLYVDRDNDRAQRVYERFGMTQDHYLLFLKTFPESSK